MLQQNEKYKKQSDKFWKSTCFKEGDLVWIHLRKERFPPGYFGKLKPQANGPIWVLQQIGENAYKIELLGDYGVLATFNIANLSSYEEEEIDLRTSPFQLGENNGDS